MSTVLVMITIHVVSTPLDDRGSVSRKDRNSAALGGTGMGSRPSLGSA
jgi:hypothetical protein